MCICVCMRFLTVSWSICSAVSANLENSKFEDEAPDEEDDGQRRRKRPKKVSSKENLEQSGIYQSHPLKVTLHINDDEPADLNSAKLIALKFEFLIKLDVVCVGVEGSEEPPENNILCNLFPNDTGLELPQQVCFLIIQAIYKHGASSILIITRGFNLCSRLSSVLLILFHLMKRDLQDHTNGPSIWLALISYRRCHHYFQSLKNQIVKQLNIFLSHRGCQYIVSRIGCRLLCKGFAPGKRLSWLSCESLLWKQMDVVDILKILLNSASSSILYRVLWIFSYTYM